MLSKETAPSGAFPAEAGEPAMSLNSAPQGSSEVVDASVVRIGRMLRAVYDNELTVRAFEDMRKIPGRRYAMVDGRVHYAPISQLAGASLIHAKAERDNHLGELKKIIDYALTTNSYENVPCPGCRLPADALEFATKVVEFEPPAMSCAVCSDQGVVRQKKSGEKAEEYFKRVSYYSSVLDDVVLCSKIRAGTADASDAYLQLESKYRAMLMKFSNEMQTPLECEDAEQGVRQGFLDAARKFDPLRKEGAQFATVAYNWCRRNSRARHNGQKRVGLYAPSSDAMTIYGPGGSPLEMRDRLTGINGAFGIIGDGRVVEDTLTLDVRDHVSRLLGDQRQVVEFELAGLSTGEISDRTGFTRVKVRRLRETAYAALREPLTAYVSALHE